jgi:hypothetical protein
MRRLDELILQLHRLGYRTQTLGKEIVVEFGPGSRVRGSQKQIETILRKLDKKRRTVGLISTWALREHPDYVPPVERGDKKQRSVEKVEREAVTLNPVQELANSQVGQPTYAELLARLKRLEAQRDAQTRFKLSARGRTGKPKKKKRKRKAKRRIWTVPGGLPSLGKRR